MRRRRAQPLGLRDKQGRLDRADHVLGDAVLQVEHVGRRAIEPVGPQMRAGDGVDQLPGDAQPIAAAANATLEHIADAEVAADLADIDRLALVGEGGVARDHGEAAAAGKRGGDVLGNAIGKIILLRIAAHIGERQHRDRRTLDRPRRGDVVADRMI